MVQWWSKSVLGGGGPPTLEVTHNLWKIFIVAQEMACHGVLKCCGNTKNKQNHLVLSKRGLFIHFISKTIRSNLWSKGLDYIRWWQKRQIKKKNTYGGNDRLLVTHKKSADKKKPQISNGDKEVLEQTEINEKKTHHFNISWVSEALNHPSAHTGPFIHKTPYKCSSFRLSKKQLCSSRGEWDWRRRNGRCSSR